MAHRKVTQHDMFSDKMNVNLNVLCLSMVHQVASHVHYRDILAEGHPRTVDVVFATARYSTSALDTAHG
jgi:hypothetical protein